jgi:hypothetical protein
LIAIDGQSLTLARFRDVVLEGAECSLTAEARERVDTARRAVEETVRRGEPIYGVNTGFGDLATVGIEEKNLALLQERLILSHCAGVGEPLPDRVVRGMLLLRANTLARGHSGVRALLIDSLLTLLNSGVLPLVPSRGSVGASGDLAPLAHLALPLLGKGEVRLEGRVLSIWSRPSPPMRCAARMPPSTHDCTRCGRTRGNGRVPPTSGSSCRDREFASRTGRATFAFRIPTVCAVRPRFTAPPAICSPTWKPNSPSR